ncbi:hypothetical protein [uncultured Algibacter sp.]|uniref:hypothetical protein n=1 Tax=uncultured Algibacter sp. TaxID=298659 RepID=UPI0032178AFF
MSLINFVQKNKLPTKIELENRIKELGYDFKFLTDFDTFDNLNKIDTIDCLLNGNKIFVEIYLNPITEILSDFPNLKKDLSDKNFGISFSFGSEELVCACINIISIGLMDLSQSIVFYADDEVFCTRKMLIDDIEAFLDHNIEGTYSIPEEAIEENLRFDELKKKEKKIKNVKTVILWGLLFFVIILMKRKSIYWIIPSILLVLVLIKSQINLQKKRKPRR